MAVLRKVHSDAAVAEWEKYSKLARTIVKSGLDGAGMKQVAELAPGVGQVEGVHGPLIVVETDFAPALLRESPNGCWHPVNLMFNPDSARGYKVSINKKQFSLRSFLFITTYGGRAKDRFLKASCGDRSCCNPAHHKLILMEEIVTGLVKEKIQGESNGRSKLTSLDVHAIRRSTDSPTTLAARYNVDRKAIRNVINRVTWKYLSDEAVGG